MIHGKFYLDNYDNWRVYYFMVTDAQDAHVILNKLRSIGCSQKFMGRAKKLLYSDRPNTGLAYSNRRKRKSVIVVSETTDIWEFFNSFAHEIDHIEKHIAQALGFSPYSEDASYLVGEIIKGMFYEIVKNCYARTKYSGRYNCGRYFTAGQLL